MYGGHALRSALNVRKYTLQLIEPVVARFPGECFPLHDMRCSDLLGRVRQGNYERIVKSIVLAKAKGATFRVGPELEIPGYGCLDHFLEGEEGGKLSMVMGRTDVALVW